MYLIVFLIPAGVVGSYILLKKLNKLSEKASRLYFIITAAVALFFALAVPFTITSVMIPDHVAGAKFENGCINLVGVPFGSNRFLNFIAWFLHASVLPSIFIAVLTVFFPSKFTKTVVRYASFSALVTVAIFFFIYNKAMTGYTTLDYKNIFLAFQVGTGLSLSALFFVQDFKVIEVKGYKEIIYIALFYLTVFIASIPVNTPATLLDNQMRLFGYNASSFRAVDFSQIHRIFIYIAVILPILIYFVNRDKDVNTKKVLTIAMSLGVLAMFFNEYGYYDLFLRSGNKITGINVNNLPIHLCHTALYVVPICITFNLKKLFYFTYFINVFGAVTAMLWPNTGETSHFMSPGITLFWYNHVAAYAMPLLAVALGIFEKPKMKQMLYSLAFFGVYMLAIVIANTWLSNYVEGYDPNVVGSGTDYLFVNGTYVLDIISKNAYKMLNIKWQWSWGKLTFVLYPLYQPLFFVGYTGIAFVMWFVYSLFFRISDSHKELHNQLVVMRKERITFKEKIKMAQLENELIDHQTASLKFIDFSKRYGNSDRLSANHVNLEVKAGEVFGFLGPNGAGKSTCIKTAIGIQPVTEGTIEVCGFNVSTQSVECKKCIGYVPDHYALYEKLTGREYINYIADLYGVSKADRDARISKYVDLFELNQAFDNRMHTYSHGMKQKMTIMAALVHNPKIWILDEPLTGLDPQSIYQVKEVMKEHAKAGNIVFFSSHIINVVEKLCTRIAIIKKGQIVYEATMEEVEKTHPEGLEEFYMKTIRDSGDMDD